MAFEQRFQRTQINDRKVVNTLEDQNKYDISSSRRLRVQANPVNMRVEADTSGASQLLKALSDVRPALLNYATDKLTESYTADIQQGKTMSEEEVKNEMQQFGYDNTKGLLQGEDFASKMKEAWDNAPKELGEDEYLDFDSWYQDWWKQNAEQYVGGKSSAYMDKFIPTFQKSLVTLRASHNEQVAKIRTARTEEVATEHAKRIFDEVRSEEYGGVAQEFNVYNLDVVTQDLRTRFPNMESRRIDEILYGAAKQYAEDTGDYHVLPVFKENHADGTPGLGSKKVNDTTRFAEQIDNDVLAIQDLNYKRMKRNDELATKAREKAREDIYKDVFTAIDQEDGATVQKRMMELYEKGYFSSITEMNTELNAWMNIKKKAETADQQLNALNLRIAVADGKNLNGNQVWDALKNEEISYEGAKMVLSELEARTARRETEARADQRKAKEESRLDKDGLYNRAQQRIKDFFPNPYSKIEGDERYVKHEIWKAELVRDFQTKALGLTSPSELAGLADKIIADNRLLDPAASEQPIPANSKRNDPRIMRKQ